MIIIFPIYFSGLGQSIVCRSMKYFLLPCPSNFHQTLSSPDGILSEYTLENDTGVIFEN